MRLSDVSAQASLTGGAIELRWKIPAAELTANPNWRVRAARSSVSYPEAVEDGMIVMSSVDAEPTFDDAGNASYRCIDAPLRGETVYYYTLFPHTDGGTDFRFDQRNRTAAPATSRYGLAEYLYKLLPAIYHRYDTVEPPPGSVPPPFEHSGQLRRFLEIVGSQFDQFYSLIRALSQTSNTERVDGRLLPLLAAWIGWESDLRQRIDAQRNEIRSAPYIYHTIGLIPTIEATVKRVIGWESRVKEFVHNVLMTNAPEEFILRSLVRIGGGDFIETEAPVSFDSAYGGHLAVTEGVDNRRWLFYHTRQAGRWEIWHKTFEDGVWSESQPSTRGAADYRNPSAALWNGGLLLLWDAYDHANGRWRVEFRTGDGAATWSGSTIFSASAVDAVERRKPMAAVDPDNDHLWLFWQQRDTPQARWSLRYARFTPADPINASNSFPTAGESPAEGDDLFPIVTPAAAASELWLIWSRRVAATPHLWEIAARKKGSLDPATNDWGAVETIPRDALGNFSDREPSAIITNAGAIELFWSSDQDGSSSIWRAVRTGGTWSAREPLTDDAFSQRSPSPFVFGARTVLLYRDNRGITHTSTVYTATETLDLRYSGSSTVDPRNRAKLDLARQFDDFQTYIYDAGQHGRRGAENWYARDTIGIFLTPDTDNPILINRNRNLIEGALRQFLPIQVRFVLIIEPTRYNELVYSYSFGSQRPPWLTDETSYTPTVIGEVVIDSIPETLLGPRDEHADIVIGWVWIRSWQPGEGDIATVDTTATPIDTHFRIFHKGLEEG